MNGSSPYGHGVPSAAPCPRLESLVGASRASVPELLRARAATSPDRRFLRFEERKWTYAEALGEAERFAGYLRAAGVAGARIASYTTNRPEALWAWFGTQLAGGTYVPLNRSHRGPLLADMMRRSGAHVLLTEAAAVDEVTSHGDVGVTRWLVAGDIGRELDDHLTPYVEVERCARWAGVTPAPGDLGMVMYTSGSTGRSKAVRLTHNQHCRGAAHIAESFGLRSDDVWHGWAPLYHVLGQLYVVLASVVAGGCVALRPRFTRTRFWEDVAESEATVVGALANMMRLVWALPDTRHSRENRARLALINGQFADLHEAFERRFDLRVIDCYGLTEAEPATLPAPASQPVGSHGTPSGDFDVAILDEDDLPVPPGTLGEIVLRPRVPDVLFRGYEGDAERTVEAFRNLWFHTGDLGSLDAEGFLHFSERRPHAIRRNGENISAHELETIIQSCPGVVAAAAVGIPERPGEDEIKVSVVVDPEAGLMPADIHAWCRSNAASFMVPRYVEFVELLPTLDVGKVDKRRLQVLPDGLWDADSAEHFDD